VIQSLLLSATLLSLSNQSYGHDLVRDVAVNANVLTRANLAPSTVECDSKSNTACDRAEFERAQAGFHGQLFFGTGPFYVSHLPLYSQPHNYQAIYEVEFPDTANGRELKKSYLENVKGERYGTFAPGVNPADPTQDSRSYKIPELTCHAKATGNKELYGAVYSGHFERFDQKPKKLGSANFKIKRVVYYKELSTTDPAAPAPADPARDDDYIVFGENGNYFAARVIGSRPGVDHIFPVTGADATKFMQQNIGDLNHVRFQTKQSGNKRSFSLKDKSVNVPLQNYYLETGELQ
jgi:hypothetical protein